MIWAVLLVLLQVSAQAVADSCSGRCNDPLNGAYSCQCNSACERYGDCCTDYMSVCLATCTGRCSTSLDTSRPCQCGNTCYTYNDCCPDYESLCNGNTGGDVTLSSVVQDMWNADLNKMSSSDYSLSLSGPKLFVSVNEQKLASGTYQLFTALLNNYEHTIGLNENVQPNELQEISSFLDAVLATEVMAITRAYLVSLSKVSEANFRSVLEELWFNLYPRSSSNNINDSSGFEHVMVGETKGSSVSGFHNWIQFYNEEKAGNLVYNEMPKQAEPNLKGAHFTWNGGTKTLGSFFVGTSPEFDLALYTMCALIHPNARCNFNLEGNSVSIQTWDIGHKAGNQIGSAYPAL